MALNIKNAEVERLAAEVAHMARETKTEAIRRALEDRKKRLRLKVGGSSDRAAQIKAYLTREVWPHIHYEAAVAAYLRFGKGRHPAALNFGDCMSYALASESGLPLLYTGDDFARVDIQSA